MDGIFQLVEVVPEVDRIRPLAKSLQIVIEVHLDADRIGRHQRLGPLHRDEEPGLAVRDDERHEGPDDVPEVAARDQDQPVQHRNPQKRDESHRGWNRKVKARYPQREHSSHQCKREIQKDQVRVKAKKIDDLQALMKIIKEKNLEIHLEFINFR